MNEVCAVLVDHGADLEEADQDGNTPVLLATKGCHSSTVSALFESGAKINVSDKAGLTPLLVATQAGHIGLMEQLLEYGARVKDHTLQNYHTDKAGNVNLVRQLLECESSWKINKSNGGQTHLHIAAKHAHYTRYCSHR